MVLSRLGLHQEELKEWNECLLMLGESDVDEHGNVHMEDQDSEFSGKDGEDREINVNLH